MCCEAFTSGNVREALEPWGSGNLRMADFCERVAQHMGGTQLNGDGVAFVFLYTLRQMREHYAGDDSLVQRLLEEIPKMFDDLLEFSEAEKASLLFQQLCRVDDRLRRFTRAVV